MGPSSLLTPLLKVWTARSAKPFEEGWYGDTRICRTPLSAQKFLNSALVKPDPLSETICDGKPWVMNSDCSLAMVHSADVELTMKTSIHLEWASTTIRNNFP